MARTSHHSTRLLCAAALSLGLLFMMVGAASASTARPFHASVTDADPKIGSSIAQAPAAVTVTTAENMKPGAVNSNLFVYGPKGDLVSQGDATIGLSDPKHMSVKIKGNDRGVYVVQWKTVSADDGDPDQGAFVFTVGAATSAPAATTTATAPTSSGIPLWVPIVAGVVALLVGLGAGIGIGRAGRSVVAPVGTVPAANQKETTPSQL